MTLLTFKTTSSSDLQEMQQLFVETVTSVCNKDYSDEQLQAWISGSTNTQRWLDRFDTQFVLLAKIEKQIVGFGTIKDGNYIDMFFVHKDFQGKGIARKLFTRLEQKARELSSDYIESDVSITAKPFFEKMDFTVLAEQKVVRNGVELVNYRMRKILV